MSGQPIIFDVESKQTKSTFTSQKVKGKYADDVHLPI
jgi:hypothetical protein